MVRPHAGDFEEDSPSQSSKQNKELEALQDEMDKLKIELQMVKMRCELQTIQAESSLKIRKLELEVRSAERLDSRLDKQEAVQDKIIAELLPELFRMIKNINGVAEHFMLELQKEKK